MTIVERATRRVVGVLLRAYDKSRTYSADAVNADLRYDLVRSGRRSRCFSRCMEAR